MQKPFSMNSAPIPAIQAGVFLAAATAQLLFWVFTWTPGRGPIPLALVLAGLLISALAGWVSGLVARIWREQQGLQCRLDQSEIQMQTLKSFMSGALRMDTGLQAATSEEQVMETALGVIVDLTGARGASFVPLDEWGQPLPAHTFGRLPPLVLKAWTEHLTTPETRETCRNCQKHLALPGEICPLMDSPFLNGQGLFCFPMERGERLLGMVNLYVPGKPELNDELVNYLKGLLSEVALAVDSIRLRTREINTLKQLQMIRPPKTDLRALLMILIEGVHQALEVEAAQVLVRGRNSATQPDLKVEFGELSLFAIPEAEQVYQKVITTGQPCLPDRKAQSCPDGRFAGFPLRTPEGQLLGCILLANSAPFHLEEKRLGILQSVVDEASLLIQNEQEILSIEYRTVIQERARLAREIHDGLAQTLAFLKLQSAQMQSYLSQGNLSRLEQVLKQNYETLAEAYLDTRQVIDNLRLTPNHGLHTWLEQMAADFEAANPSLEVERSFNHHSPELTPEIQAQLVRIIQEALSNIRKHAHASHVVISLREWNRDLILEVKDNGLGFSPQDVPALSQYGLRGMRERAELIGADFQVISKAHQGTTVRLSYPISRQETVQ